MSKIEALNDMFDNHPSLPASIGDFDRRQRPSPVLRLPSHRSGFRADMSDSDAGSSITSGQGPWSPPGLKSPESGSAWYRHQPYLDATPCPQRSTRTSPSLRYGEMDEEDLTLPCTVPLPRGSVSPMKEMSPEPPAQLRNIDVPVFGEEVTEEMETTPKACNNCKRGY